MDLNSIRQIAAALDIHKQEFNIAVRNHSGFIAERNFHNDTEGARQCHELLVSTGCTEVAAESSATYWYGPYDYLDSRGIRVTLVNPARAKSNLIANKSDRLDARTLATLHLLGQLKPSYVPPPEIRRLRRMTRFRAKLIDMKTQLKNAANSSISAYSGRVTSLFGDIFGVSAKKVIDAISRTITPDMKSVDNREQQDAILKALNGMKRLSKEKKRAILDAVSKAYSPSLDSWIIKFTSSAIEEVESWISALNDAIAKAVESIPRLKAYVERLLTILGVGLETAQAIVAEIADITRFVKAGSLVRYSGLNPKIEWSGKMKRYGKLEKGGPKWLRRALYQAAQAMAFHGPENFQKHYAAVRARYGEKRGHGVGVTSTARKLTRLIWAMLTNGTDFMDSPTVRTERKTKELSRRARRYDSSPEKPSLVTLLLNLEKLPLDVRQTLSEL